jgi:hypothetical protein
MQKHNQRMNILAETVDQQKIVILPIRKHFSFRATVFSWAGGIRAFARILGINKTRQGYARIAYPQTGGLLFCGAGPCVCV